MYLTPYHFKRVTILVMELCASQSCSHGFAALGKCSRKHQQYLIKLEHILRACAEHSLRSSNKSVELQPIPSAACRSECFQLFGTAIMDTVTTMPVYFTFMLMQCISLYDLMIHNQLDQDHTCIKRKGPVFYWDI